MKGFTLNKYKVLGLVMIMILWATAYRIIGNSVILPSPLDTGIAFKEIISDPKFLKIVFNTLSRILISFILGLMLALPIGIMAALNQWFYDLLSPMISLFKIVPTMAIVILALIWLTNTRAPVLITVIIVLPLLYEAVIKGIRDIDPNILSMASVYQVRTIDIIKSIYIPSVLGNIEAIFSSTIGLCLKVVIGGEVLGQPLSSIGSSIQTQKMYLNTAGVLGWIIVLVILSLAIDIGTRGLIYIGSIMRKGLKNG